MEMVLGAGFLLLVVLIFISGNPRDTGSGSGAKGHTETNRNIVTVTADNWQKEVLDSPTPVLVDFWAPWCGPCRMLAPAIDLVATKLAGKVKVAKVNVDDAEEIAGKYRIEAIPTVLLFHHGVPQRIQVNPAAPTEASAANIAAATGYPW